MLGVLTFDAPPLKPSLYRRLKPPVPFSFSFSFPTRASSFSSLTLRPLVVRATVAEDFHNNETLDYQNVQKLKIAIIGFGNYGQFLARTLVRQGHTVLAHSRSDHSDAARDLGVAFFPNADDLCDEHPEVILLCCSIISLERVLLLLPYERLKRGTLFVDVLSVKEYPRRLLRYILMPYDFDIVCSHPMFGPESASPGWNGMPFVYEKVRIRKEEHRVMRCQKLLNVFEREGCRMVEMTCADHDFYAAESQFITHTLGRVLGMLMLESTPINTEGYESLLNLVENTAGDSFDLYLGLYLFNKNSEEMLDRLHSVFQDLRDQLTDKFMMPNSKHAQYVLSSKDHQRSHNVSKLNDNKSDNSSQSGANSKLKIAIVGFGNFGQFLAKTIVPQGHEVLAYSRSDYSDVAQKLGVSYFNDADDLCEQHPEVILLCTSILSTESVLKSLPVQRLKRGTLFVDVLSVKEFARALFLKYLPPDYDVLCTHPMFGPESGKNGWKGLPFVFDKVRIGGDESKCNQFLEIFSQEGCRMVQMSCAEHDMHAVTSQLITRTTGRILEKLKLEATPIDTKGYETLLSLVDNTAGDSFDPYYGLFRHTPKVLEQLRRLIMAFHSLRNQLYERLYFTPEKIKDYLEMKRLRNMFVIRHLN